VRAPQSEIDGCRDAHLKLASTLGALTDEHVRRPSLLPNWTVGHVLTHIARNAEAMTRRIDAAIRDEIVEQYAGGYEGRAAEIETGATRNAAAIVSDVNTSAARLDAQFASLPDDCWSRPVRTVDGDTQEVSMLPFHRWREVEIHLVDLDLGVSPADWPDGLVDRMLPRLARSLADRCDGRQLMAWGLGRGPAPDLEPWG
jgi:maleylpyruvate isomerase